MVTFFEKHLSGKFSAIVTVTQAINERFSEYNKECFIINNYPKFEEFGLSENNEKKQNEICYIGGITKIRGIEELIDALEDTDILLNLAGNFESDSFRIKLLNKPGWKRVNYLGYITPKEAYKVMSRSIAGISTLYPEPNYLTSQATKVFEYMFAGIPVIASNFPMWKEFIEKHNCGISVDPKDPAAIKEAIFRLKNNPDIAATMGKNGEKSVIELYSWTTEEIKLLRIYFKILNN
jgi:glycosyltransferase involved in cell wall biosynthesis